MRVLRGKMASGRQSASPLVHAHRRYGGRPIHHPILPMLLRPLVAALLLAVVPATVEAADRITGHAFATRSEVIAPHAMAATSQPLATQIALDVMKSGGSAVDAAIRRQRRAGIDGAHRQRSGR
jgi:Gamma-glutamyltransferase